MGGWFSSSTSSSSQGQGQDSSSSSLGKALANFGDKFSSAWTGGGGSRVGPVEEVEVSSRFVEDEGRRRSGREAGVALVDIR